MTDSAKIRVLCVDDRPRWDHFRDQLQKDMELVGEAATGEEAVAGREGDRGDAALVRLERA